MELHKIACVAAALTMVVGAPAMAQSATPKPARAPGVEVERTQKLMVGDRAPELAISEWVKGDEVTGFEEGKVYVVEFWATWCGPCIGGMPHVSELQKEYKDKGVTVIGVNIWDDPAKVAPFMEDRGNGRNGEKNPTGDELMGYTVAIEKKIEGEDPTRNGEMAKNWMRAAGQNGIPSAFVVDQKGYIAWIGHPMRMDDPLEQIVAGEWDIAEAAAEFSKAGERAAKAAKEASKVNKIMAPIAEAFQAGEYEKGFEATAKALKNDAIWSNPNVLNSLAWNIVDPDAKIDNRNAKLAVKIAERAAELTDNEAAPILDTLAWAYYFAGDKAKAIKVQTKAISLLSGDQKAQYEESLTRMKK
jgi:thiol-disulfide isomerase/thioredoxin